MSHGCCTSLGRYAQNFTFIGRKIIGLGLLISVLFFIFLICVCCRYDNVPPEINRLRCRVNYHALKFLPEIEEMSDLLVSRMRNRTGVSNPYMYVTLISEVAGLSSNFL